MRKAASPGWAYPMGKGHQQSRPSLSGAEEVRAGAPDPHAARSTSQGVGRQGKLTALGTGADRDDQRLVHDAAHKRQRVQKFIRGQRVQTQLDQLGGGAFAKGQSAAGSRANSGTMMRGRAAVSVRPRRDTIAIILSERFFYFSTICPMCKTAALFCLHLRILYGKIAK